MARLVIVCGPPGAGKTTLARRLGAELRTAVLIRDEIKEALLDVLGAGSEERSGELGRASFGVLYRVAGSLLESGVDVVVEANFRRGMSEAGLAPLVQLAEAIVIHCHSDGLLERFLNRDRHSGHHSQLVATRMQRETAAGVFDSPDVAAPILEVDCTEGYSPSLDAIVSFVKTSVGG